MNQEADRDDLSFAYEAARQLRRSEGALDRDALEKLAAARRRALAAARPATRRRWLLPTAGIASVLMAGALLTMFARQHMALSTQVVTESRGVETLDLLTDKMSPAFYHDLEFYQWLEKERPHA